MDAVVPGQIPRSPSMKIAEEHHETIGFLAGRRGDTAANKLSPLQVASAVLASGRAPIIGAMSIRFHLAQVNIGRFRAAIDDPIMDGFRTQLDPINAIADRSPGFVWRLQTEDGNATAIRPYADERMAINMSVWESLDALRQYVYKSAHVGLLRDRKEWFEPIEGPILALWWVPAGQIPTVAEALDRLEHLKVHGPTRKAFTFRTPFAPPDMTSELAGLDAEFCEWAT
jgi:hypothetical protein